ncbi:MAG: 50S ribosomal protein L10 [Micavibrio aeruginosavorus]|uniref:Large ribosomal subunit protein uL10 n=1 Tax=Micavibrio aeruginosavorus TaxID=349221 RepID=A0A7T5UGX5_9BACT|nr:MAG: 50S ribosomal protein L10 [Micavibrio aeruginosavorus]
MTEKKAYVAKQVKTEAVAKRLENAELVILTHNKGLTHLMDRELRNNLRKEGATFGVEKNTLVARAVKGTKFESLTDKLKGPVGIAISNDPLTAARVVYEFAKKNDKIEIIGGATPDGALDIEKIKFLAMLPTMDQLRGKIVGLLQAPGAQLARLANAYATKDQAAS